MGPNLTRRPSMGERLCPERDGQIPDDTSVETEIMPLWRTLGIPAERSLAPNRSEIRSIVPLGRGYFPHDARHFVPA